MIRGPRCNMGNFTRRASGPTIPRCTLRRRLTTTPKLTRRRRQCTNPRRRQCTNSRQVVTCLAAGCSPSSAANGRAPSRWTALRGRTGEAAWCWRRWTRRSAPRKRSGNSGTRSPSGKRSTPPCTFETSPPLLTPRNRATSPRKSFSKCSAKCAPRPRSRTRTWRPFGRV